MLKTYKHYNVAVVGGGPAGIMAAIFAARADASVVLLEKNEAVGRKILATGNGRCNITNRNIPISRYHGSDITFAEPIFADFGSHETIEFFESIGVLLKEEDRGRIFPRTDQASTVVNALRAELTKYDVTIHTGFTVKRLEPGEPWHISDENGKQITADKVILTTGGKAAHQFGSSGDGLFWAKNFGHEIVPIHAALVPLETTDDFVKDIMGIRLVAHVSLLADGKLIASRDGDILFTHYGISGPAAMGLAREVDPLLIAGRKAELSIDMMPDLTAEKLDETIVGLAAADGKKAVKTLLAVVLPKNLVPHILATCRIKDNQKAAEISKSVRQDIVSTIKDFRLGISKVRPLKEAQVTAGGITTSEVTPNLESKIVPGLYFAGEILDIDGDSGGFNLQWAWSSGKVAGEAAARGAISLF